MRFRAYCGLHTKFNSKWITDLNVRAKTTTKMGVNLCDLTVDKVLNYDIKSTINTGKQCINAISQKFKTVFCSTSYSL